MIMVSTNVEIVLKNWNLTLPLTLKNKHGLKHCDEVGLQNLGK